MIFKRLLILCCCISLYSAQAQQKTSKEVDRPKLVVGIMVDQMRWDYLYRYYDRYGEGGFKRMLNNGFSCENTYINYIPTVTAIGHSSVYTGTTPAIHGIAGNDFIIQATGKSMYCTEDETVIPLGTAVGNAAGKMSPRNLLASTITDELKLASNFRSKVIGIAIKDRGAILPAGHFADAAYWFDNSGDWISSSYYMTDLPKWVKDFNKQKLAEKYLKQDWNTLYPIETYKQSIEDNNPYEGKFKGTQSPTFPVKTSQLLKENGIGLVATTPYGNTLTLDLAKAAISNEELGNNPGGFTDFLAISISSPDKIGHQFAVNSIEVEDNYLRLDKDLEDFFSYLDKTVGQGQYTVFLTADHGAAHNPQYFMDQQGNGGYFNSKTAQQGLNEQLKAKFNTDKLVISLSNYQVHLNNTLINERNLDRQAICDEAVKYLRNLEGVAFVAEMDKVSEAAIPSRIKERIINGYNYKRSGAIQIVLEPQWYSGSAKSTGTTHGNWNPYDSHIPLVWMGWGIKHGATNRITEMTDIAATVAGLLHIQEPNGSIGSPIVEVLNQ
ncbi:MULTISPECIES: alkaline phosphatase PafA [Olivibacter]|uniref:Alkaline phosphatase PafA n=1 Tax=Olivibacter oleidegradans TaxID=760123 RepID=A0ABV6HED7_9SPHI|nr:MULTISPECIES: alkaline phosphatase PafA [Olivibacter]QEK99750.1 alkaline phosphatase family protein [Olivibacter sp. LS-1]